MFASTWNWVYLYPTQQQTHESFTAHLKYLCWAVLQLSLTTTRHNTHHQQQNIISSFRLEPLGKAQCLLHNHSLGCCGKIAGRKQGIHGYFPVEMLNQTLPLGPFLSHKSLGTTLEPHIPPCHAPPYLQSWYKACLLMKLRLSWRKKETIPSLTPTGTHSEWDCYPGG